MQFLLSEIWITCGLVRCYNLLGMQIQWSGSWLVGLVGCYDTNLVLENDNETYKNIFMLYT
jgi:hypothetical protein